MLQTDIGPKSIRYRHGEMAIAFYRDCSVGMRVDGEEIIQDVWWFFPASKTDAQPIELSARSVVESLSMWRKLHGD